MYQSSINKHQIVFFIPESIYTAVFDIYITSFRQPSRYNSILNVLSPEAQTMLLKRMGFITAGNIIFFFIMMYSIPALYFQKTSNPFKGIINGIIAIFKKPLFSVGLFFSILIANIIVGLIEMISFINPILMFLALVLRVYFAAFVVVLIFSVYEKRFADNCNNRPDCFGENELSD